MKRSAQHHSLQRLRYIQRCEQRNEQPRQDYLDLFDSMQQQDHNREHDPEWCKDNLEYDLRSADWICAKARASQSYAQNVYAALCNQTWQRNEVWPLLQNKTWSCSWRYAGGIVADMCGKGDYMDWYCSGIGGVVGGGSEYDPEVEKARLARQGFVSESVVTDEVREDLFKLGWIVVDVQNE